MRTKYRVVPWIMAAAMVFSTVQVPQKASAKRLEMENCGVFKVMPIGSTFQLKVRGKSSGVKYTSGRDKVVSVSKGGLLRAEKKGTAIIRVQKGGQKARLKIQVKPPTGYTISNPSGTYVKSVKTRVKAKKGYTIYYTTGKRFKQGNAIRAGKSRTFAFRKSKTLKLYALSSSARMTTVNLNKTERFSQSRGDYLYHIVKGSKVPSSAAPMVSTAPSSAVVPSAVPATVVPSTGAAAALTENPPSPAASEEGTNPPSAPSLSPTPGNVTAVPPSALPGGSQPPTESGQPGQSGFTGDDAGSYTIAEPGIFDAEDEDTEENGAVPLTIPQKPLEKKAVYEDADGHAVAELSKKNKLTITYPGTYIVTTEKDVEDPGKAVDAKIEVAMTEIGGTVHLILAGVNLASTDNDADLNKKNEASDAGVLTVKDCSRMILTLKEGTVNQITDTGKTVTDEWGDTGYPCGILCKKVPLTINGAGVLNITSQSGNGIKATNALKILNATVRIGSETEPVGHNGISGKLGVDCRKTEITVYSSGDGLKTTLDDSDVKEDSSLKDLGNISIEQGAFTLASTEGDAVSAYRTLYLNPENMNVATENRARQASGGSCKALKAGTTVFIPATAGVICADTTATCDVSEMKGESNDPCADDTVHCDGYVCINGGDLTLKSGDDGIHADAGLLINGGTIQVAESYEGLEAGDITINGGTITIRSRDDGINAGGGNDAGNTGGPGDQFMKPTNPFSQRYQLIISGGDLTIDAEGDGIDCNGNIFFRGGTVTVDGPERNNNGALDYGEGALCEISGGTLIAAGAVGMDAAPTGGSSQPVVNVKLEGKQKAGTYVVLRDADGNHVLEARPAKDFQSVILSCEAMKSGETYMICYGSSLEDLTEYKAVTFTSSSMTAGSGGMGFWRGGKALRNWAGMED